MNPVSLAGGLKPRVQDAIMSCEVNKKIGKALRGLVTALEERIADIVTSLLSQ